MTPSPAWIAPLGITVVIVAVLSYPIVDSRDELPYGLQVAKMFRFCVVIAVVASVWVTYFSYAPCP